MCTPAILDRSNRMNPEIELHDILDSDELWDWWRQSETMITARRRMLEHSMHA